MAQSRLEKIGTIYTRITSLMKGGVLKEEDVPLWFAVYKAFPPKYEPRFDRPGSQVPVKNIYYSEDLIRAKFQEQFANVIDSNFHSKQPSKTQQFLDEYRKLEKEGVPSSELYDKAVEKMVWMLDKAQESRTSKELKQSKEPNDSKSSTNSKSNIDIKNIFEASA